jgi:hypothetical protein
LGSTQNYYFKPGHPLDHPQIFMSATATVSMLSMPRLGLAVLSVASSPMITFHLSSQPPQLMPCASNPSAQQPYFAGFRLSQVLWFFRVSVVHSGWRRFMNSIHTFHYFESFRRFWLVQLQMNQMQDRNV